MTAIEHQELKGITIKNLIVTIMGTASIVVSVMTTYFNLRAEIDDIRFAQQTEQKITSLRISVLETEVGELEKEANQHPFSKPASPVQNIPSTKNDADNLFSSAKP